MMFQSQIKKLCALALAAAMSLTLLGCGGEPEESGIQTVPTEQTEPVIQTQPVTEPGDAGMVTIYALTQMVEGGTSRMDYGYDESGNLTAMQKTIAESQISWDEEYGVYVYVPGSLEEDGYTLYDWQYDYDSAGNLTECYYTKYDDDGSINSDYSEDYCYFFNEKGEIIYVEYRTTQPMVSPLNYCFSYEDGRIVNVDVYMTTYEGEVYGDVVKNYRFEYDDQGRLSGEYATFSRSEYCFEYIYDAQGRAARVEYYKNEDGEETRWTHEFAYNENTIFQEIFKEDGSLYNKYLYYAKNQILPLDAYDMEDLEFLYDENGNVTVCCEDGGILCEYTYEPIEVTREQAERYYRQQQMIHTHRGGGWYTQFYYPVFFYNLIPNPVW